MEQSTYVLATKEDFDKFREVCDSQDGWTLVTDKKDLKVWDRTAEGSNINMVRMWAVFKGISAATLYDVLHDADYRKDWDENMAEGYLIQQLDNYNDIGYYAGKSPFFTISGRDFCNQRMWWVASDNSEYIIKNYSVIHKDCPEKKGFVRAQSLMTGYMIRPDPNDANSCQMTYLTQTDLKGWIPDAIKNQAMKTFAPKLVEKLAKVSPRYDEWKTKSEKPKHKPWLNKEPYHWEKK
eukprot:TRINITY_DN2317_c0_g1_i1.p1 TRINITY_DN2317_c0_g1~~TRINITY_DN2317_c0_g1_i1.p1  ORF type:complete len:237 (-),score=55.83 TRINITY_DN2317_c0_g1_i1:227-937(-)